MTVPTPPWAEYAMPSLTHRSCNLALGWRYSLTYVGLARSSVLMITYLDPPDTANRWSFVANMLCTPPVSSVSNDDAIFGCAGSARSSSTTPLMRLDAPSRDSAAYRASGDTVTSLIVRASTLMESVRTMF